MINLKYHQFSPYTVLVSRVKRVIENPEKIAPVSCTMVVVEDSYYDVEGDYSFYETIAGSRVYCHKVLKGNAGVSVNLSKLRPKGTVGTNGLIAQGVTNFMQMYSMVNAEVRRGNGFKNGAVVICLAYDHPDILDFLAFKDLPWAKKGVTVDDKLFLPKHKEIRQALLTSLNKGEIFISKDQYNKDGEMLYPNVCYGLSLKSRSTCTLAPVNLGLITYPEEIADAFVAVYKDLDLIWRYFNETHADHFIAPIYDKQIGLGMLGLSNMLANFKITYEEFVVAMEYELNYGYEKPTDLAYRVAYQFRKGYDEVSKLAKQVGYERVFAIEPTASCSYKQVDYKGYTCSPEISPPVCNPETKITRRQDADGFQDYQYNPDCEVAGVDVPWQIYDRLCIAFQELANSTGLAQGISYNWWLDKPVTEETLNDWNDSPLKTIYYRWATSTLAQDKTSIGEQLEGAEEFWSNDEDWGDEVMADADFQIRTGNSEIACECGG